MSDTKRSRGTKTRAAAAGKRNSQLRRQLDQVETQLSQVEAKLREERAKGREDSRMLQVLLDDVNNRMLMGEEQMRQLALKIPENWSGAHFAYNTLCFADLIAFWRANLQVISRRLLPPE